MIWDNDAQGGQGNNFGSGIIETITSRTSSGPSSVFKKLRLRNLCCKSSWTVYWKN